MITTTDQRREVDRQVAQMLGRSRAFAAMPPAQRAEIQRNTAAIVETMAGNALAQGKAQRASSDPYAVAAKFGDPPGTVSPLLPGAGGTTQAPTFTGGAQPGSKDEVFGPQKAGDFGTAIATGVSQAGALLRQVNFPAFVAELVQGVFQAVVDASIQQMKAYGELVQGVVMSLNDFRDQNVSENQGRDHLVSKFPQLMQINITDQGPRVGLRPDANTDELPDIAGSLGMSQQITDLDDEIIEQELVPAARNDLARSRQSLLATMLLMGIQRIVVTDGKINAKLKFSFSAKDSFQGYAQHYDYENMGTTTVQQSTWDTGSETGEDGSISRSSGWLGRGDKQSGDARRWSTGESQLTQTPAIYLTSFDENRTEGELKASAELAGSVSLNFKSESFDLNQLASADEVFRLERVRGAGRGAPAAGATAGSTGGAAAAPGAAADRTTTGDTATPPATNP